MALYEFTVCLKGVHILFIFMVYSVFNKNKHTSSFVVDFLNVFHNSPEPNQLGGSSFYGVFAHNQSGPGSKRPRAALLQSVSVIRLQSLLRLLPFLPLLLQFRLPLPCLRYRHNPEGSGWFRYRGPLRSPPSPSAD